MLRLCSLVFVAPDREAWDQLSSRRAGCGKPWSLRAGLTRGVQSARATAGTSLLVPPWS